VATFLSSAMWRSTTALWHWNAKRSGSLGGYRSSCRMMYIRCFRSSWNVARMVSRSCLCHLRLAARSAFPSPSRLGAFTRDGLSGEMDTELLSVAIPISHFVLADRTMDVRFKRRKTDEEWNTRVFSMKTVDDLFYCLSGHYQF